MLTQGRWDYAEEIVIFIGDKAKRFVIHKNVVCSTSSFFKAACGGTWKESKEKAIKLPEVDEDANLAYSIVHAAKRVGAAAFDAILKSYILGDFFDDKRFYNALVNKALLISHDFNKSQART